MFEISTADFIAPDIKRFSVHAARVAAHWSPGQFVIIRVAEDGERIPLTVVDADRSTGVITLVVQGVGRTTREMNQLEAGDRLADVAGPLGAPTEVKKVGTVVVVGGGVGNAIAFPVARALSAAGNRVVAIIGARTATLVILEDELARTVDEVIVATDDGSRGQHGMVTDVLSHVLAQEHVDRVVAVGPVPMMRAVADLTREAAIPTVASLNPIMIDGTGMCGGCRVLVDGDTRFACVDGPEFDAHQVDFEMLSIRNRSYREFETAAQGPGSAR